MGGHIFPWWFAYTFDNRLRHFFHNPEKMLCSYLSKGMTVLGVGCGMGFFSLGLARRIQITGKKTNYFKCFFVDISPTNRYDRR